MTEKIIINSKNDKCWFSDGVRHRAYGPAVMRENGEIEFWFYGEYCEGLDAFARRAELSSEELIMLKMTYL